MLQRHHKMAREHVALGERHIERQKGSLAELDRDGHDTAIARRTLAVFEAKQAMHVDDLKTIEQELAAA